MLVIKMASKAVPGKAMVIAPWEEVPAICEYPLWQPRGLLSAVPWQAKTLSLPLGSRAGLTKSRNRRDSERYRAEGDPREQPTHLPPTPVQIRRQD